MKTLFIAKFAGCNAVYGAAFEEDDAIAQADEWIESDGEGDTAGLYCEMIECGDDATLDDFSGCCDDIEYMRVAEKTL